MRSHDLSPEDVAAIRELEAQDAPWVLSRDWDALVATYEEDAVRMPPDQPSIQGRDAIRAWLEELPPVDAFEFELLDLQGQADLAFARGTYSITLRLPDAPDPIRDVGKILIVLRRQPDGSWRRVMDAWNSDGAAEG